MRQFKPEQDIQYYRKALGSFATGITVVTTAHQSRCFGITANSFASVSLNPPLVLWSPDKNSDRYDVFVNAEHFAIHILSAHQKSLCDSFARSPFAFEDFSHTQNAKGVPILKDCLSIFECQKHAVFDGGDHSILVGRVMAAYHAENTDSLIYAHGHFSTARASA